MSLVAEEFLDRLVARSGCGDASTLEVIYGIEIGYAAKASVEEEWLQLRESGEEEQTDELRENGVPEEELEGMDSIQRLATLRELYIQKGESLLAGGLRVQIEYLARMVQGQGIGAADELADELEMADVREFKPRLL